jgi:hypothetical protein
MHWFQTLPSRTAKVITDRSLRPRATVFACTAIASFGFMSGTLEARDVSDQSGLREVLADLASGRNVSARVSLPLQIGFFNGKTALYITPEVGVDPNAGPSTVAAAQQVAVGFNANFIPLNFASLPGSGAVDDIFVFTNFNQGNVLSSAPNPAGPAASTLRIPAISSSWRPTDIRAAVGHRGNCGSDKAARSAAASRPTVPFTYKGRIIDQAHGNPPGMVARWRQIRLTTPTMYTRRISA